MLIPPMLATILGFLAAALTFKTLLLIPIATLLLLVDTFLTTNKIHKQGLQLSSLKVLLARGRAVGSLGYYLGYHLLRYYLLPFLLAVFLYSPLLFLLLSSILGVGLVDYRVRNPRMSLAAFYLYYVIEQLSYGSGAFWGCLKLKNFSSYRLDLKDVHSPI